MCNDFLGKHQTKFRRHTGNKEIYVSVEINWRCKNVFQSPGVANKVALIDLWPPDGRKEPLYSTNKLIASSRQSPLTGFYSANGMNKIEKNQTCLKTNRGLGNWKKIVTNTNPITGRSLAVGPMTPHSEQDL